jgi:hypothetical protein
MTCAVDFIVERSENVLLVPNAALRYQPTTLSAEQISDMVFNASLVNMNEEQRQAAIEARAQSRAQGTQQRQTQNSAPQGITQLMMGQSGQRMTMPGGGRQMTQGGTQGRSAPLIVMRNLWYINGDGRLDVMQVRTGISDGSFTEVFVTDDFENKQVILRERI